MRGRGAETRPAGQKPSGGNVQATRPRSFMRCASLTCAQPWLLQRQLRVLPLVLRPAATDSLPSDVVLVILRKLAAQDPLALFRVTCASAPFYRAAAANPEVWEEAYCVTQKKINPPCSFNHKCRGCTFRTRILSRMAEEDAAAGFRYHLSVILRAEEVVKRWIKPAGL